MPENNVNNRNVKNDEIEIIDLFKKLGITIKGWANAVGRALLISAFFLLKRWLPLGLSIALGIGMAFFLKSTSESSYTSDLVLRSNTVTVDEIINYINRLHNYCLDQSKQALTEAISLTPDQIKNINDISAYWIIDNNRDGIPDYIDLTNSHNVYDTINIRMRDRVNIRVKINSPQELNNVKVGIIKFIQSDPLFQQRNNLRLKQNREMLSRFNYDILQLDSLQKVKYFEETRNLQPKSGGQVIFLQEQKTQLIYTDIYALYARKQAIESEQDLYTDLVTVLSEFTIPTRRDNGGTYYAKIYVPLFFLLTLLILILIANRRKLTDVYNKY